MPAKLLLASASPRRREILELLGLPFAVIKVKFEELTAREAPWLSPGELAQTNALGKARAAQKLHPHHLILAADTVVALGTRIFEKPSSQEEAQHFLRALSGRTHCVHTALSIVYPGRGAQTSLTSTQVTFRKLSLQQIKKYLAKVHVLDKAGGYAIQEHSDWIIESIEGPLSNVIGLPLATLAKMLKQSPKAMFLSV